MENTLEDLQPFLGVGLEQTAKFSLGQHGDLGKLLPRDPKNGLDLGVDLSGFGDQTAVGKGQLGLGLLQDQLIAPLGGALVLRVAPDGVLLPGVLKHQLHFRGRLRRGVFGAKHLRGTAVAAGLAEEGEGNGIKNRSFARPGVPGDEVETMGPQLLQSKDGLPGVGAKGG